MRWLHIKLKITYNSNQKLHPGAYKINYCGCIQNHSVVLHVLNCLAADEVEQDQVDKRDRNNVNAQNNAMSWVRTVVGQRVVRHPLKQHNK
jgi:hypothetical protein